MMLINDDDDVDVEDDSIVWLKIVHLFLIKILYHSHWYLVLNISRSKVTDHINQVWLLWPRIRKCWVWIMPGK